MGVPQHIRTATVLAAVLALAAGCTGTPPTPPPSTAVKTATSTAPATAPDTSCRPRASLRPVGALPRPGHMPAGGYLAEIAKRGLLRVGTSQDTLLFSSRDPITGQIVGFDIDMAHQVAEAIFGDPKKIQIVVVPNAERVAAVQNGTVDLIAHTMTMNCKRWKEVDFSTVYYDAGQKILVAKNSTIAGPADLGGKKVCAAAGSTSLDNLARLSPTAIQVALPTQAECLVAFQRNQIDAISTDDTILAGLAAQDPYAKVVGDPFSEEPYGLAVSKQHKDLTRFVNAVLAQHRADGTWQRTYRDWLGGTAPKPPVAQYQD